MPETSSNELNSDNKLEYSRAREFYENYKAPHWISTVNLSEIGEAINFLLALEKLTEMMEDNSSDSEY